MRAEGVAEARRTDAMIQNGEIDRMEDRIAYATQCSRQAKHDVAVRTGDQQTGPDETRQAELQNGSGPDTVDDETGRRLTDGRKQEENRGQQAKLSEIVAKFCRQR